MIYRPISKREQIMPIKFLALAAIVAFTCTEAVNAACGCSHMTLKYQNAVDGGVYSNTYCVDDSEDFSECQEVIPNTCGAGKKTWRCPIGGAYGTDSVGPWVGIGFEVETNLPNGTNLNDCTYGQGIQRNLTEDGILKDNKPSGHDTPTGIVSYTNVNARLYSSKTVSIPHLGDVDGNKRLKLASDYYSELSSKQTISYSNNVLRWSDLPSIYLESGDTQKNIVMTDRFIAFIKDKSNGTVYCACKFLLQANKNAGGDILNSAVLTQEISTSNCVFSPQP